MSTHRPTFSMARTVVAPHPLLPSAQPRRFTHSRESRCTCYLHRQQTCRPRNCRDVPQVRSERHPAITPRNIIFLIPLSPDTCCEPIQPSSAPHVNACGHKEPDRQPAHAAQRPPPIVPLTPGPPRFGAFFRSRLDSTGRGWTAVRRFVLDDSRRELLRTAYPTVE
ncbi:hypothetical protein GSI_03935 [Ganoderma sinense ZZ0214-1]|uniref:Uncharacterized protein n=1 Tax=Ganoderma sinense ZZ0214-1 TaxID=1077348 RepID=A0A2G8SKC6_9APHY|nr:hypothetical protein GSI_03935 [Ganoderma sinense ZZ0214-1]